ncbi:MAG: glycosyltransferase [Clostridia bacterium]|nr:glycosyltransferase [Clostridia bacterium]
MIDDIEAEEYYFVSHANYEELHRVHGGYIPPIDNPKLTHYIGVSQFATDKLEEYRKKIGKKIKTIKCYNPLTLEPKQKLIHLVSACRLDDKVKGGGRTLKLIEALDRYCEENNRNYIWTIFTNPTKIKINSPNVIQMQPRLDVRPFIADADYVVQLSNDMETYGYTINEALGYGVPIVTTPLSILKELPITDNEHIVLDWDCENVDEVARQIFEKEVKPFEYKPLKDDWDNILAKGRSNYKQDWKKTYLVECIEAYTDIVKNKWIEPGEQWEVDYLRMEYLNDLGLIKVIEEIDTK